MGMLKALVIGMAGLILVGVAVIAWGLAHHWTGLMSPKPGAAPSSSAAAASTPAPPISGAAGGAEVGATLAPPVGMHFAQMATAGDLLVLRFTGPQGERIVTLDPRTGRVVATIAVPETGQ